MYVCYIALMYLCTDFLHFQQIQGGHLYQSHSQAHFQDQLTENCICNQAHLVVKSSQNELCEYVYTSAHWCCHSKIYHRCTCDNKAACIHFEYTSQELISQYSQCIHLLFASLCIHQDFFQTCLEHAMYYNQ